MSDHSENFASARAGCQEPALEELIERGLSARLDNSFPAVLYAPSQLEIVAHDVATTVHAYVDGLRARITALETELAQAGRAHEPDAAQPDAVTPQEPTLIPVVSSNIAAVGYHGDTLAVRFRGGALYHYRHVPPQVVGGFFAASSLGQYLHREIRNQYETVKVAEEGEARHGDDPQ